MTSKAHRYCIAELSAIKTISELTAEVLLNEPSSKVIDDATRVFEPLGASLPKLPPP